MSLVPQLTVRILGLLQPLNLPPWPTFCPSPIYSLMLETHPVVNWASSLLSRSVSHYDLVNFHTSDQSISPDSGLFGRAKPITTFLPALLIILIIIHDLLAAIGLPRLVRKALICATKPFQNFLCLGDLEEFSSNKPLVLSPPRWKQLLLVTLPLLEGLLEVSLCSYHASSGEPHEALRRTVAAFAWVSRLVSITYVDLIKLLKFYASWRTWLKQPSTPPYLLLMFYISETLSSSVDMIASVKDVNINLGIKDIPNLLTLVISISVVYTIGTLPLKSTLPCHNVATCSEV